MQSNPANGRLELGVDIGGTFTDVVLVDDDGGVVGLKVPTTPGRLTAGVMEGVRRVLEAASATPADVSRFVHGTTVATNAVLEHRGAATAVVTTNGFRDVLDIGRLKRRSMYDLFHGPETPGFISPRRLRVGVPERVGAQGEVVEPLDEEAALHEVEQLVDRWQVESLAICLLNAHVNPGHERRLAELIGERFPELHLSVSTDITPVEREYERLCVTVFDAYVRPTVRDYLTRITGDLTEIGVECPVHVVVSRGANSPVSSVLDHPVETLLSGLAAGIRGAATAADWTKRNLITFDMGGTSCDVALVLDAKPRLTAEGHIAGYPLQIPMVDVHTIGAGGGSIAWLDSESGLRVGPQSAGAEPGPACYGRGGQAATVTDASVVLGYMAARGIGREDLLLDVRQAQGVVADLADALGLELHETALGIHRIVNEHMADLVRLVTVRAGHDPRECALVAFGGAGPMHACAIARSLGIATVVVPSTPGLLCAVGALYTATGGQAFASFRADTGQPGAWRAIAAEAERQARALRDVVDSADFEVHAYLGMRYADQSHDIEVPFEPAGGEESLAAAVGAFEREHQALYGYKRAAAAVEVATVRVVVEIPSETPVDLSLQSGAMPTGEPVSFRAAWFPGLERPHDVPVFDRRGLREGQRVEGPAIVEQADCTTVMPPGCTLEVVKGNLLMHIPVEGE